MRLASISGDAATVAGSMAPLVTDRRSGDNVTPDLTTVLVAEPRDKDQSLRGVIGGVLPTGGASVALDNEFDLLIFFPSMD
jgi:hypothetical protein